MTDTERHEIIALLYMGREYAGNCLARHDMELGRERPRHRKEAEDMEVAIKKISAKIQELKK